MNNKCLHMIILILTFTILILLTPKTNTTNEHFAPNLYNWRDLYYGRYPNYYSRLPLFKYLENRDRSVLYDPLVAPERRIQSYQYPYPLIANNMINYPTRGLPDNYQQLGIVTRKSDEKMLQLFGRQTFPRSTQWEYYVRSEKDGFVNKIPIQTRNQKELEDGDEVEVPGMNEQNGKFIVKLYNYNTPRYNPYVF